jgi:hypothetical protein
VRIFFSLGELNHAAERHDPRQELLQNEDTPRRIRLPKSTLKTLHRRTFIRPLPPEQIRQGEHPRAPELEVLTMLGWPRSRAARMIAATA